MYEITSLRSLPLMMTFGMRLCEVCSAAERAALLIPGILAIFSKGGASRLGENPTMFSTRWHSAHCLRAILIPRVRVPPYWPRRLRVNVVARANTNQVVNLIGR